jgi:hypothetical protein
LPSGVGGVQGLGVRILVIIMACPLPSFMKLEVSNLPECLSL